jgi:hypothetical protein
MVTGLDASLLYSNSETGDDLNVSLGFKNTTRFLQHLFESNHFEK